MRVPIVESIWKPVEAIRSTRDENSIAVPIILLTISALIFAIASAIATFSLPRKGGALATAMKVSASPGIAAILSFVAILIGGLLLGLYLMMVMRALNTKASYFAGIATMAHVAMPISIAFLIFSVLSFGRAIGIIIGVAIALIFLALAAGTLYHATREFFETDMVTALVGVGAFVASLSLFGTFLLLRGTFVKMPTMHTALST